jgi:hypothetical protein
MQPPGTRLSAKALYFLSSMTDNIAHGKNGRRRDRSPPETAEDAWNEESNDDERVPER